MFFEIANRQSQIKNHMSDIHQEILLDHFKNPRNRGLMESPDFRRHGVNPACGDEVELTVRVNDKRIKDIKVQSSGCVISQASASMMTEMVKGKLLTECADLVETFRHFLVGNEGAGALSGSLDELSAFSNIKNQPGRVNCAMLPWIALLEGIWEYFKKS